MRALVTELLGGSPLLVLPVGALVIFVLVFGGVLLRVLRSRPARYQAAARLPLEEDDRHA